MKNRSDINRMASMMGKVKNGLHMMGDGSGKEKRVTKKAMNSLQIENRKQVDNWNIGKLSNFGETIPETKNFAEFKEYEQDFRKRESREKAPEKMYNHSTGKKQPTGRELVKDRNDKRSAKNRQYLKTLRDM